MSYSIKQLREIAESSSELIRSMADGTEISSAVLIRLAGYDPDSFSEKEHKEYYGALFRIVEKHRIALDVFRPHPEAELLPRNLVFRIHNKAARSVKTGGESDPDTGCPGDICSLEGTVLRMITGDITKITDAEAIVNAANRSLLGGGGVDGAIHRAAGPELLEECRRLHGCPTGEARITGAYRLPCRYIIHTVGPVWSGGGKNEPELLSSCYRSCLLTAADHGIRSIAFPSISTGAYRFPLEKAAYLAVRAAAGFIQANPGKLDLVEWVLFDERTFRVYDAALCRLTGPVSDGGAGRRTT